MSSSQRATLESVCSLIADCPHSTPVWTETGFLVIRNQNIKNGKLDLSERSYTDLEHYLVRVKRAKPQVGDLIVTREAPMGDVCMVPEGLECCVGQRQVLLRPNPEKVVPRYLLYAIQSPEVQHEISWSEGTGSTVSNIRIPVLKSIKIPLLPLKGQAEISTLLGALDDRIALLRETNATLEAIAQALFKSWFVDFDPVHAKQQGIAPEGMDESTAAMFPDGFEESELGVVPRGWKVQQLGDICVLQKGCSYKGDGLSASDGAYMFNLGCFNAPRVFATEKIKRYTGEYRDRHSVVAGDLIVANTDMTQDRAILGRPLIVPKGFTPSFISHHVFKVEPKTEQYSGIKPFLFFTFLQPTFRERAVGYAIGTTVLALPKDALQLHQVVLPDSALMDKFTDTAGTFFSSIETNLQKIETITTLRDTLLPRLISGQLRLPDVDETLEETM